MNSLPVVFLVTDELCVELLRKIATVKNCVYSEAEQLRNVAKFLTMACR